MSNKISLKYVSWGLIDNMSALVQIMARRCPGDKPLSEPMLTQFTDAYMWHQGEISLYISVILFMPMDCPMFVVSTQKQQTMSPGGHCWNYYSSIPSTLLAINKSIPIAKHIFNTVLLYLITVKCTVNISWLSFTQFTMHLRLLN